MENYKSLGLYDVEDKPIDVYNYGKHRRDFTYIDDIVEGIKNFAAWYKDYYNAN